MNAHSLTPAHPARGGRIGVVVALVLLGVVFFFAWKGSRGAEHVGGMTLEERYEIDDRIHPLLADCGFGAAFEADTTDLVAILVSKLDAGAQRAPQRRAKTDLAKMGERVAEPLMRLFQSASKDRWRGGVAKNVLTVCSLADGDWGVPIALEALRSPVESIRADAAVVIRRHPDPAHYDFLEDMLLGFQLPVNIDRALNAMHACDPERFARQVPKWIAVAGERDGYIQSSIIDTAAPLVASIENEEIAALLLAVTDETDKLLLRHRAYLIAPAARVGNAAARQELMDLLAHDLRKPRHHACEALASAGLVDQTYVLSVTSEDRFERSATLARILELQYDEERSPEGLADVIQWARKALLDDAEEVREVAIHGLLLRRDEEGRAALMALLRGDVVKRGLAMHAMREALVDSQEAADQARTLLIQAWETELAGSRQGGELTSILQTLGAVPGRETGEFLLAAGDLVGQNPIRGISGFRWCVGQAFNAGPSSREALRARLALETDPIKRLDLISFIWQDFEESSLDCLLGVIEDDALSPYERLYTADRVVRMGQSERVVPVLKRIYRSDSGSVLRPALHCLLWVWYGPALS